MGNRGLTIGGLWVEGRVGGDGMAIAVALGELQGARLSPHRIILTES